MTRFLLYLLANYSMVYYL